MPGFKVTIKRTTTETVEVEGVRAKDEDAAVEKTLKAVEEDPNNKKYDWSVTDVEYDYDDCEEEDD